MNYQSRFIVLGSSNMDLISYTPRIPVCGETIIGNRFETRFGGKGANQAVMISKLVDSTQEVVFVSKVGEDSFGKDMKSELDQYQLNTKYVSTTNQCSSGIASINIDEKGNNNIIVIPGANFEITKEDIDRCEFFCQPATIPTYLIVQFEIPMETICYALKKAKEMKMITIVNPAPASSLFPKDILCYCDYLCPNETEFELFIQQQHLIDSFSLKEGDFYNQLRIGCEKIVQCGAKNVIITLGEQGSYYYNEKQGNLVESFKVNAVDTVGAGDCFIGSFVYYLSKNYSVMKAIRSANFVASISVSRYGAQKSYPTIHEIEEYEKNKNN